MDEEERRYKEVEKRERLVQTFLIIGGFLVAYTREEAQQFIATIFSLYLIFTILYYIFVSRTINNYAVNYFAFFSSYIYAVLILAFLEFNTTNGFNGLQFIVLFIVLTTVLTFSVISPETSERLVKAAEHFFKKQQEKHPKPVNLISIIILIIFAIVVLYFGFTRF